MCQRNDGYLFREFSALQSIFMPIAPRKRGTAGFQPAESSAWFEPGNRLSTGLCSSRRSTPIGSLIKASLIGALIPLAGCMSLPAVRTAECGFAPGPAVTFSLDGKTAHARIDVLTYNIEGLPWPARRNRAPLLREIAQRLAAFRAGGSGPQIIVFQEVFSNAASRAVVSSGYQSLTAGPRAGSRQDPNTEGPLPGRRRIMRGEIRSNFLSSGLVTATDWPIISTSYRPFARGSCAGFDCLSNKGVLYAEIAIPGVPGTIDVFNTHMQARRASRVSEERHAPAHHRQTVELSQFVDSTGDPDRPTIVAGDFNMRNSDIRWDHFKRKVRMDNVHRFCADPTEECEVLQDWEHPDQWRRVQDKHFFAPGQVVKIRPVRAEGMFDDGPSGPVLSDHEGFRVIYELSWPADAQAVGLDCPARTATVGTPTP